MDIHGPPTPCHQWPRVTQTLLPLHHTQPPPKHQLPFCGKSHRNSKYLQHVILSTAFSETRLVQTSDLYIPDELREINTSAIFMYIICHLNFILWFWIWFMISILAFHMETHVYIFTIQIILWYFWIWFLWYFIFTFMWNFTIRVPCLGSGRAFFYLIRNTC